MRYCIKSVQFFRGHLIDKQMFKVTVIGFYPFRSCTTQNILFHHGFVFILNDLKLISNYMPYRSLNVLHNLLLSSFIPFVKVLHILESQWQVPSLSRDFLKFHQLALTSLPLLVSLLAPLPLFLPLPLYVFPSLSQRIP